MVLHVFAQPSDELESLFKEQLREGSRNVATIPKQLAAQVFHQVGNWRAIIDVARSQTTRQQLTSIIDGQVQFKAKEPAHARFATPGIHRKDAMLADPFGVTDLQRSRVNEADARAGSIAALQVSEQGNQHPWHESNKALIAHQMRKFAAEMGLDMLDVVRLERAIVRLVKMDQNRHHLTWAELTRPRSLLATLRSASFPVRLKAQQNMVAHFVKILLAKSTNMWETDGVGSPQEQKKKRSQQGSAPCA